MFKYALIVALGATSYGTLTSFAKIAYGEGYTAAEITFAQASLGALILWILAFLRSQRVNKGGLTLNWKLIFAGTTMGISTYFFYLSVQYIPVALAIVLLMQVSWISNLCEWLIFKRKLSTVEIVCSVVIIIGTILAGNLFNVHAFNFSFKGVVLALSAAFIYTSYVIFTSKLGNDIPALEKGALMTTGSALMILAINLPALTTSVHLDLGLLKWGGFLALFGTVAAPICFTVGMPKIGPGLSAIILTMELPAVVLSAFLILGEKITLLQVLGIVVMIGAIILLNLSKIDAGHSRKDWTTN